MDREVAAGRDPGELAPGLVGFVVGGSGRPGGEDPVMISK